jgi:hypothetical protein
MPERLQEREMITVVKRTRHGSSCGVCFPKELRDDEEFATGENAHYKLFETERGIEVVPIE